MLRTMLRLAVFGLACVAVEGFGGDREVLAQAVQPTPRLESRLGLSVDTFCSEAKLRTSNARIRWTIPKAALDAHGLGSLAAAPQSLEVTVHKNGFEKGLGVALPVSGAAAPTRPIAPQAQAGRPQLRALQITLISVEQSKALATDAGGEMSAVVEDLEPGVNYTWRVAIDTATGRIVSPAVTTQGRICPADEVRTPAPGGKR